MAVHHFDTLDDLRSFWRRNRGYLLNNYKNCLHETGCESYQYNPPGLTYTQQGFDTPADVVRVLGFEGRSWYSCPTCNPHKSINATSIQSVQDAVEQIVVSPNAAPTDTPMHPQNPHLLQNAPQPFTESQVELKLVPWLESEGYKVDRRVRVSSGIIDLIANGADGRWVIEAKGEDKGGYTSAEMNFQIGIGQIVSRMDDASTNYALAMPLTPNFRRVLRKFRGTLGFEKMGMTLFTVAEAGTIQRIPPADISQFLDTLE